MARRRFLAQLVGLPFLSLGVKDAEPKKTLKIMMKSAWGSDDPTRASFPFCTDSRWRMPVTKCRFSLRERPPI
jgi:nuclear transport factor 2 (NTF2) superfamily protein